MDREAEVGLAENKRLDEGSLGLRVKAGLGGTVGLRGWLKRNHPCMFNVTIR